MTRVFLACVPLLLLPACQVKGPKGTIRPEPDGAVVIREVRAGTSRPFHLNGGKMTFQAVASGGITDARQQRCQAQFTLTPYVEEGEQLPSPPIPMMPNTSVDTGAAGFYVLQLQTTQNFCWYAINLDPV